MQSVTETWRTPPKQLLSGLSHACLVHIYPSGPEMGTRYPLGEGSVVLGRDRDCDICLLEPSVSRKHACIHCCEDGYYATDQDSTNGTYVNDQPITRCQLRDGDYLRVGNCIYRFLIGGNVETEYHEEIYRLTIIDALTDTHNKRYFMEFLDRELARSSRYDRPLSLVMMDIDRFRAINEELGHLGGDFTLRELSSRIKGNIRKEELFARYGGEEFAVVLPETSRDGATRLADRLVKVVNQANFVYEDKSYPVTISAGVACTQGDKNITPHELIRKADEKLYQAKHAGRNCVVS